MQKTRLIILSLLITLSSVSLQAQALTLDEAWHLALNHDPGYLAALKEQAAANEDAAIATAGLLPAVSLSWQNAPKNWQQQNYSQTDIRGQHHNVERQQQYQSYSGAVTLVQPLLDYEAWARYQQGIRQKTGSEHRLRQRFQDLAVRVVEAYLKVVSSREKQALLSQRMTLLEQQRLLNQRLYRAGEAAITELKETEAEYALAVAEHLEAGDVLEAARGELEMITGQPLVTDLPVRLTDATTALPLPSGGWQAWQKNALALNPQLQAMKQDVESRRYDIERKRAAFFPRVELYATHSQSDSATDTSVHQQYRTDSLGIRVKMALYAGGSNAASIRQATAKYEQAQFTRDAQRLKTVNELRQFYNQCLHGPVKIQAWLAAVAAARTQLSATRKSILAGQRINIDLLNAGQKLFKSQLDLADEKFNYMKAWINLLDRSGTLSIEDLATLNRHLME
ncbi:TolC family outer membrane protein [Erwinia mallotivora]|uniref:TolC family outer membrane protein n=1 Tax=Erwinia mallotivora TaxID=69222 RepID=UPI0021C0D3FC|nr:TolC family outer membrane protein [Erwinia mallotivora]